ncbi:MAG: undecaprenyl/decaprenyl-phosphate alpha-N-acetylglucosaminyl 1-phosphate transferase [Gammaproteobacteria bacterium]|nr:undecaprenyl/decaprenyl-phosphate alpha-N-acetylglucosaminyl 1-phosphate transferase [Gammaproteobacteria bacterium]
MALILLISAAVISMAVIPLMMRLAPVLGMIDQPDARKVHAIPVSRVGGIGIVIGALLPLLIWFPIDELLRAYLIGAAVLMIFGAVDDARELGHYVKFIGQGIAVISMVYVGDLWVSSVPFFDYTLPAAIGKPFTVFAMIGVINALNHSDGLDGLASGEALLSLMAIVYLSYLVGGDQIATAVAMVTIGGIFGFLRFNTHPARVFMGDSGSQFLGFTIGFLAVLLTQRIHTAMSPAVVLLLIGLPIVDILVVFYLRASGGMNWFKATRNHIHHRLLDLGFEHYETVVIIYSVQTLLVASGILLRYQPDWLITLVYLLVCITLFALLTTAERRGWRAGTGTFTAPLSAALSDLRDSQALRKLPYAILATAVPLALFGGAFLVAEVPQDFAVISGVLVIVLLAEVTFGKDFNSIIRRGIVYVTVVFLTYLLATSPAVEPALMQRLEFFYFGLLAVAVALTIRYCREVEFRTTPTDYLLLFIVLAVGVLPGELLSGNEIATGLIKAVILIYASELLLMASERRWTVMMLATIGALTVFAWQGLLA